MASREETQADFATAVAQRHDWLGAAERSDRDAVRGGDRRTADFRASATDSDASLLRHRDGGLDLGYQAHDAVDGGKARIVLAALAAPAEVQEIQPALAVAIPQGIG